MLFVACQAAKLSQLHHCRWLAIALAHQNRAWISWSNSCKRPSDVSTGGAGWLHGLCQEPSTYRRVGDCASIILFVVVDDYRPSLFKQKYRYIDRLAVLLTRDIDKRVLWYPTLR